ncbi:hypothetical protein [Achromobacter arsenitoxydans]|uniref:hypothetical protein n=1 Tax=Achromobacter arsenitoxydans TaxID=1147684 RepID=UPI0005BCB756|nr:hypothetical protein [Achromobacter arsenitoxydans]
MRNRLRLAAAALAAALYAAPAMSACGPADAGFPASGALTAVPVSVDLAQERVLLGHNGERVATHPLPVSLPDARDPLPRTWMDKVDWSAYRVDGGQASAATLLLFDADGRLCRVERRDRPRRGPPLVSGGYAFEYDAAGVLLRVAEYEAAADNALTISGQVCLKRDAQGALEAFIAGRCGDTGAVASRRYVRNAAGALLRVIDAAGQGAPVAVQTFDEQGRPRQRYVRQHARGAAPDADGGLSAYAQPASTRDRLFVLERDGLSRLSTEVPGNEWRIVRIKDGVPIDDEDMQSWDPRAQTVLAEGVTGSEGQSPLASQDQTRVWNAMRDHPGRVFWYVDPMSRLLLTPAMAPAAWRACTDPGNLAGDACG